MDVDEMESSGLFLRENSFEDERGEFTRVPDPLPEPEPWSEWVSTSSVYRPDIARDNYKLLLSTISISPKQSHLSITFFQVDFVVLDGLELSLTTSTTASKED